jgi:methyl-accepting chemotaxis protein
MPLSKDHREFLRKSTASLEEAASNIDSVRSELQEAFDDLSDASQQGDKGECLTEVIANLEETFDTIEQITATLYDLATPTPKKKEKV